MEEKFLILKIQQHNIQITNTMTVYFISSVFVDVEM